MQGGAVLRGVDRLARCHAAQEAGQLARLGEPDEEGQCLGGETLLGKVGQQVAAAQRQAREALRVGGKKIVEMTARQRVAVRGERLPLRGLRERRHGLA